MEERRRKDAIVTHSVRKRRRYFSENAGAFTLIELALVTVIILTLIGLSLPFLQKTFSDLTAKDTVFTISKLAAYAQERSVMNKKILKLVFDFRTGRYQLFEWDPSVLPPAYSNISGRFGKTFSLPQGLFFKDFQGGPGSPEAGNEKMILFYPDGHCDDMTIEIAARRGGGYIITAKGSGSLVRIKEVADAR